MPDISVVIPVYNVEKYLRQCLDSVINQTLKDIEIICINDGSTDDSLKILHEYALKDKRMQVITKPNGGYGSACNAGLDNVTGGYIAILEPDDFIEDKMYEKLYNLALAHEAHIVKSPFYENFDIPYSKKIRPVKWYENNDKFSMPNKVFTIYEHPEFLYFHPSVWSCIYRADFLKEHNVRFVEAKGAGWTDNPFQVQTMCLAKRIFYTNERFYYWRRTHLSGSDKLEDYTVPFKRSDEIHQWLDHNKITEENLLACLYKRELAYISTVFEMKRIENFWDCLDKVKAMCNAMPAQLILNSKEMKPKDRIFYWQCKYIPLFPCLLAKLKQFRKKLISIRLNKNEKSITLFGKYIILKEKFSNV